MTSIGCYQVKVLIESSSEEIVFISSAIIDDLPTNWTCNWLNIWNETAFYCQNIVKLVYNGQVWGLVKYSLYPYFYPELAPPIFMEINNLEAHPTSRGDASARLIEPIGKWLVWYAIKVALEFCQAKAEEPLVILEAVDDAVSYYRDKVQMEYLGFSRSTPSGEDLYAFRFSRTAAEQFCQRQESEWGKAKLYE
ncbi:hypothetical protein H6G54_26945 [Anabaena cylindrica FACHB-243]|uniref:N-acetyltransferase domain-containing protein n=1 Tax=Anabaena cylindrica (strain ATCC 27899 / PCC 7122) TaxID=272123 RepID=K9ZB67_ANACC|nr:MULTISPECIES: hypothetical protein [Anabaena]AFZ55832.1 hypothetical protein Anacy_0225 [Anabaena cylindrica PCC 7122]MBD2421253.1 hypothetical protein [Anabaena cylindrica FACHB-243]MBY5284132.1 hypothetical protein [Anabaena sp. CCAP 1446/1C]MBY5308084.1 hypothetical protein [Anabaena sp. CCAP 1446/1C]MCM2406584.1 hypothetical protein [Anabaena sp. CCAP 1446/1C]